MKTGPRNDRCRGAGEMLQNFLGRGLDIYVGSIPPVLPHLQQNRAKCPLVTSADWNAAVPKASALRDLGIPSEETRVRGDGRDREVAEAGAAVASPRQGAGQR